MGLDLTYVAKNNQLSFRLSSVDSEIASLLRKENADEIDVIFGVSDFGQDTSAPRLALLGACEKILQRMLKESDDLFCVYKHRFSGGSAPGIGNSGMISGVRMNQDNFFYTIDSGVGYCTLIKSAIGKDGRGYDIERIDIRSAGTLKTDNMGEMEICRERKKSSLEKHLKSLKDFLEKNDDETIIKILG